MNIIYSNTNNSTRFHSGEVPTLTFPCFQDYDFVKQGFSTRLGGVSKGIYSSMSLTFTRGDSKEDVLTNFQRIGDALSIPVNQMILSDQTHTTNVLSVDASMGGMGILRERNFSDVDGLITNEPGVCLVTSYADCVPLFFVDPVHKAIGASHAGWRGTVNNIARVTVEAMAKEFQTSPTDLVVMIGPSICRNCYEIGEDVADEFAKAYGESVFDEILSPKYQPSEEGQALPSIINGKFLLNLWKANETNLIAAGVLPEHIHTTDLCTCCNPKLLHSHRATKGERGGLCGFLQITT